MLWTGILSFTHAEALESETVHRMGCGSSVPPEIEIVEETSSVPPPEVDDTVRSEKVAAGDARGDERAGIRGMALAFEYPFYAVHMRDFLNLKTLKTHNELKADGLVVPLDFDGLHAGACVNFISHQWLGDGEADPEGVHLCTMQQCFSRVITNEPIFRSPEDEAAYLKGVYICRGLIVEADSDACLWLYMDGCLFLTSRANNQTQYYFSCDTADAFCEFISSRLSSLTFSDCSQDSATATANSSPALQARSP